MFWCSSTSGILIYNNQAGSFSVTRRLCAAVPVQEVQQALISEFFKTIYQQCSLFLNSPTVYRWHKKCFCVWHQLADLMVNWHVSDIWQFNYSITALIVVTLRQCRHSESWKMEAHISPLLDQALVLCRFCEKVAEYLQWRHLLINYLGIS